MRYFIDLSRYGNKNEFWFLAETLKCSPGANHKVQPRPAIEIKLAHLQGYQVPLEPGLPILIGGTKLVISGSCKQAKSFLLQRARKRNYSL